MKCSLRFPILEPGQNVTGVENGWALTNPPRYLTCDLEAGHLGPHRTPDGIAWQFIPGVDFLEVAAGELATVAPSRIPAWWVAERLEEVFGPTPPRIFHELEAEGPPYVQTPTADWGGPAF